ncbi:MAG TPA: hypothetical protein VHM16_08300 [Rubrobacteraceae bacterium]|nr:hypothetical protein [Rubrobacteraceae bacterium]
MPPDMISALLRALLAAILFGVLPGWFWAACLSGPWRSTDLVQRLAFSIALSMTLVPAVALPVINLFDTKVTLTVAVVSALVVLFSGLAAHLYLGSEEDTGESSPAITAISAPALALTSLVLGLALWASFFYDGYTLTTAGLVILAGVAGWIGPRTAIPEGSTSEEPGVLRRAARGALLAAVLALVLVRGYSGVVLHDWPYLRGGDQFNHAVMANQMLSEGNYDSYLVYPPGFPILTAGISRLSGLEPVDLFPVLAPALLILPALACYALAKRLWGWECGVFAAALSGILLTGTYANVEQARYPNLVAAQFLLVLAVAALVALYRSPSYRAVLLFGLLGSSAVLFHSVGTFYAALLCALVSVLVLPYLLFRHRRTGIALLISLALLGVFSVAFAWDTYDLPSLVGGLVSGSETGAGGEAVSIVIGTQPPLELSGLPERISPPVLWLGLLGLLLLLVPRRNGARSSGLAERATMLLWCAVLFVGSRTALSGFPQRFERDLGVPLAVLAALALVVILRSATLNIPAWRRPRMVAALVAAGVAAGLSLSLVGVWGARGIEDAAAPAGALLTPDLVQAGNWLDAHKTGGKIVTTPYFGRIPNRGMLALSGYDGLQSFAEKRIATPRSLPTGGRGEIEDAGWLLRHASGKRTRNIIESYDIRYVVLSKGYPGANPRAFALEEDLYRKVFENGTVVIFAPHLQGSA